jgi:hypothetical protein
VSTGTREHATCTGRRNTRTRVFLCFCVFLRAPAKKVKQEHGFTAAGEAACAGGGSHSRPPCPPERSMDA